MVAEDSKATRILIIEDDEDDFILASDYLNDIIFLRIEIDHAHSAQEGLKKLSQDGFDLCLLDYQLGAVNGIEVLQQAKLMGFTAPIIMLTGQTDDVLDQMALDFGAADYLVKSELTANRFARAIRYALARREVEQERIERHKAETENQAKNRFLAHLSHELRTPLTAILGYTELLLSGEVGNQAYKELDVILRNGRHLLNLLNDVLDLSKIAANKLELTIAPLNIESLVVDVFTLMQIPALDKGLQLTLEATTPIPVSIDGDSTRLRQVLINVVSNAIKFTDDGEINIVLRLEQNPDSTKLVFDVIDTGIGIKDGKLIEIFQPFTQIEEILSKSVGGSGLGLAISSELVQRMGGEISVTSEYGKGSRFTISIDPGDIQDVSCNLPEFKNTEFASNFQIPEQKLQGKVLVVDDLRDIRALIGHMVNQSGAEVCFGKNGKEAVALVESAMKDGEPFDLVLMDIHMPEMDGKTATQLIRAQSPDLPVVALTAASMKGNDDILLKAGFSKVLSKPIDQVSLFKKLSKYLRPAESSSKPLMSESQLFTAVSDTTENEAEKETDKVVFKGKVLVVEDDADAATAIALLLSSFQIDAHIAHDYDQAKARVFNDGPWDHVLLDLHLAGANGLVLAEEMRNAGINDPISILSGKEPDKAAIEKLNITQVLIKPVQLATLKTLLT